MSIAVLISCIITAITVAYRLSNRQTNFIPILFIAYFCILVIVSSLSFSQGICDVSPIDIFFTVTGSIYLFALTNNEHKRIQKLNRSQLIRIEVLLLFIVCGFWSLVISSVLTPIFLVVYLISFYCFINKKCIKVFRFFSLYLIGLIILISPILCFLIWILTATYNKIGIALVTIGINAFICALRIYFKMAKNY